MPIFPARPEADSAQFPVYLGLPLEAAREMTLAILKARDGLRLLSLQREGEASFFPSYAADHEPLRILRTRHGRWPLPDQSLDRLLAVERFESAGDKLGFLTEARRLLSPGGMLCLVSSRESESETRGVEALRQAGFGAAVSHSSFPLHWCLTAVKGLMEG
jgi:hypothetical protein